MGIAGWSDPSLAVRDNGLVDSEQRIRERQERSLGGHGSGESGDIQDQKVQIIKLISALGANGNGRKAILRAMAAKQGIFDEHDIDDIRDGSSDRRIQIPAYLRSDFRT